MMTADLVGSVCSTRGDAGSSEKIKKEHVMDDDNMMTTEDARLQYDPGELSRRDPTSANALVRGQLLFAAAAAAAAAGVDPRRSTNLTSGECGGTGDAQFTYGMVKLSGDICFGCGGYIFDRYLLQVGDQIWHVDCLRCSACGLGLEQLPSCYVRDDRIHCKACYQRHFGIKCARCGRTIQATDWVRRARQFVYHLACFACDSCKRQLSTGEEFALQDSSVLCKQHYMELLEGDSGKAHAKQKTKRVRTTFSEEQLQILQANFQVDSNPDGQDLERIAQMTGLSKRVTQVWFQNSRARQKKYQGMKVKNLSSGGSSGGLQSSACCSQENSIDIDCDDDDMDEMTRSPSPSPGPSNRISCTQTPSANVNINFVARSANLENRTNRLTIDDRDIDQANSSMRQNAYNFDNHGLC